MGNAGISQSCDSQALGSTWQVGIVHFVEPVWWRVGYAKLQGDTLYYLGIPGLRIAGGQGVIVIAICQNLLMVLMTNKPLIGLLAEAMKQQN
ncbi:hypothetical protein QJS10_CPB19g00934 [Acorus calamus]|uniref:Uncharacterized protein n=1 Tax=Acorus calamus TaxID=4465 RepID=A0AAV9CGP6_ACOCL|nr:hypothetical protein QJS10_CPB19g00934 [Acorus calamus]